MRAVFLDLSTFSIDISTEGVAIKKSSESVNLCAIKAQVSELNTYATTSTTEILARCQHADIIITNKVVINAALMAKLPQLKLICIAATGTNNIDLTAANKQNIAVCNVSGYASASVSQWVFAQILAFYNQTHLQHCNTEQGLWSQSKTFCLHSSFHGRGISELAGKTLGLIGYGSLAKAVEKIAYAFDMKVLIAERPQAQVLRTNRTAFDDVIAQADIISLHCPQTPDTEHLVNQQFLQKMKPSAILINSARGALIDNKALLQALKTHEIAYAALDVLEQEPPPQNHPLLTAKLDNLKITAHIAWAAIESQQRLLDGIAKNIEYFSVNKQLNRVES